MSTLCDPMDTSLPTFSVHGILQARILEWVAVFSSRGSLPSPQFLSLADDYISGGGLGHLQKLQSFIEYLLCIHEICMFMHFYVFSSYQSALCLRSSGPQLRTQKRKEKIIFTPLSEAYKKAITEVIGSPMLLLQRNKSANTLRHYHVL